MSDNDDIEAVNGGHNLTNLINDLRAARTEILGYYSERDAISAQIADVRARVKKWGVPKAVFDRAVKESLQDADKRNVADTFYSICREAFGLPIEQGELDFDSGKAKVETSAEDDDSEATADDQGDFAHDNDEGEEEEANEEEGASPLGQMH